MNTIWQPDLSTAAGPKYQALAQALVEAVRRGDLPPGSQLPTVRDLAWRLGITPGTVARAYALTTQKGVTQAVVGRGTFVADQLEGRAAAPWHREYAPSVGAQALLEPSASTGQAGGAEGDAIDLRALRLPDIGQTSQIAGALQRLAAGLTPEVLDYPAAESDLPLRAALCDWLADEVVGACGPEDLVVTSGGQQALGVVMASLLTGPHPVVLTEDLAYPGTRQAARLMRAEVLGVEMDGEGILPAALEALCRRHQPQICVLTTEGQNPTTGRMGLERRQQIVATARAYDLQLIDDNSYGGPEAGLPGLRALAPERSYHIGSLSKCLAPALRFGWVIAPPGRGEAVRQVMRHTQFGVSRLLGDVCLDLLNSGVAAELREALRLETAARLETLVNRLGAFDLAWQPGLAFVWLRLPLGWRATAFTRAAEAEGVLVRPADEFALLHGRAPHAVRITLGATSSRARFEAGLSVLLRLLSSPPQDLSV